MAKRSTSKELELAKASLRGRAIVLVGLMGAGKTSIGRRLADKLGLKFVDADHEIEAAAGKTIADIFTEHGESYFRDGERKVIARLMDDGEQVLATGGGALMNAETRTRIKTGGISVWLRADIDLLMKRVMKRNDRPLLRGDDPEAVMRRLMTERHPVYAQADITVESRDVQHMQMVNDVIRALAHFGNGTEQDAAMVPVGDKVGDNT